MNKLVILFGFVSLFSGCKKEIFTKCLTGNVITKTLKYDDISHLDISTDLIFELEDGTEQSIIIEGQEGLIDNFLNNSSFFGGKWTMKTSVFCNYRKDELKITATIPGLKSLVINGDGDAISSSKLNNLTQELIMEINGDGKIDIDMENLSSAKLDIKGDGVMYIDANNMNMIKADISGDGVINLNLGQADNFDASINGDGTINVQAIGISQFDLDILGDGTASLKGTGALLNYLISGDGKIYSHQFLASNGNVNISGDGIIEINVSESLNVNISGDGEVCYKSNPALNVNISGDGKVKNCN